MTENGGLINAVLLDGKGGGKFLDWTGIRSWVPDQSTLWVHLDFTFDGAQRWLTEESGLDPLVADALIADETRPQCRPGRQQNRSIFTTTGFCWIHAPFLIVSRNNYNYLSNFL